jgi:voltage-gated potassium channel
VEPDESRLERFERHTELPMLFLALLIIPLLVIPLVLDLDPGVRTAAITADWMIWSIFAVELAVKVYLAADRRRFLRRRWHEVAFVALPFLRPLRATRALRVARSVVAVRRATRDISRVGRRRSIRYPVFIALFACLVIAAATTLAERNAEGATIRALGDGIWWAATTVTTVGYGTHTPVTPMGRGLAFALMLVGIGAFGVVSASVAAFFINEAADGSDPNDPVLTELRVVTARLERIERALASETGRVDDAHP